MVTGVQSGEIFLSPTEIQSRYEKLTSTQQDFFKNLAGRTIPVQSERTFLSGATLPSDPMQVFAISQWKPPKVSTLLGGLQTTTQPEGYGFFQDLAILNEYYPRYLQQQSPVAEAVKTLQQSSSEYTRDMFGAFGNTYFNSLEKSGMQDKQAKLFQVISSAVIGIAAWGSSLFLGPVEGATTTAATVSPTVSSTGGIDPTYFGFEPGTFQSIGVSEFSFGPQQLSPSVLQGFSGSSAFAGSSFGEQLGNNLTSFVKGVGIGKPFSEIVQIISNATGKIGEALTRVLSGDFVGAGKVFGTATPPPGGGSFLAGPSYSGSSGGGGGFTGTNTGQSTGSSVGMVALGLGALLVLFLFLRRKG